MRRIYLFLSLLTSEYETQPKPRTSISTVTPAHSRTSTHSDPFAWSFSPIHQTTTSPHLSTLVSSRAESAQFASEMSLLLWMALSTSQTHQSNTYHRSIRKHPKTKSLFGLSVNRIRSLSWLLSAPCKWKGHLLSSLSRVIPLCLAKSASLMGLAPTLDHAFSLKYLRNLKFHRCKPQLLTSAKWAMIHTFHNTNCLKIAREWILTPWWSLTTCGRADVYQT